MALALAAPDVRHLEGSRA